ncbi:hypothetical protein SAMD00019534_080430 [Acytostelium subglobosum LB1]|uniref:hypothetical protein n=1 Tax=Acytostelium subglobosum LB1 TaxID=1410327 RepID=UPI000644A8F6|nr:hypothetical protein SAMD00019534_080430 [Acytostelium subglobosum LB1]GAM24868.1 hypothetical protein SAMD00019534_080430 [Acytostelium subglobosum LB1]|eukprot:XP_012751957.1 hypothetical protein SAMD00019534_080430 [Acytostelium subglobosum LB1]
MMLNRNNIRVITFEEEDNGQLFDAAFWNRMMDFMTVMYDRSVEMEFEMTTEHLLSFSMSSVPLTTMMINTSPKDELPDPSYYPRTLTKLVINGEFVTLGSLPDSLTSLTIWANDWNQPIVPGSLPPRLKRLKFNDRFNQPIAEGTFPPSLKRVNFGGAFNQPLTLSNCPATITRVRLHELYVHPLGLCAQHWSRLRFESVLELSPVLVCQSLTNLCAPFVESSPVTSSTFPSLQKFHILSLVGFSLYIPLDLIALPSSLRDLTIWPNGYYSALPRGVKTLVINGYNEDFILFPGLLPPSLVSLTLNSYHHEFELKDFPTTLTSLTLCNVTKLPLPNQLPTSLRSLTLKIRNMYNNIDILNQWMKLYLDMITLTHIHLNYMSLNLELYRITDTLFLRCQGSLYDNLPTCGFISLQMIISMIK